MRRAGLAVFVILYIAASAAVAGYRSSGMADSIFHASGSQDPKLESPSESLSPGLPQFSHAKKAGVFAFSPAMTLRLPEFVVRESYELPRIEYSLADGEPDLARAPPVLI